MSTATADTMSITSQEAVVAAAATVIVDEESDFDLSSDEDDFEYDEEQMEAMYRAYEAMLKREAEQNPPEIGYCGFPCDGKCATCGGSGDGFDMSDEV